MNEKEKRLNELKVLLKPFNITSAVACVLVIIAAVFVILGLAIKDNTAMDRLFAIGVGMMIGSIILNTVNVGVANKYYKEYNTIKKELKNTK